MKMMSSDLLRQVTVSCGLLPQSMHYTQRDNYERFLDDVFHSGSPSHCINLRNKTGRAKGRVRRGLARNGLDSLVGDGVLCSPKASGLPSFVGGSPLTSPRRGNIVTEDAEETAVVVAPPRHACPPTASKRLVSVTRREMLFSWGGVTMPLTTKKPAKAPRLPPCPPRAGRIKRSDTFSCIM